MFTPELTEKLTKVILEAAKTVFAEKCSPEGTIFPEGTPVILQPPRDPSNGNITTNIAMRLASICRIPPADFASAMVSHIRGKLAEIPSVGRVEVKGGFLNFFFEDDFFCDLLEKIYAQKDVFGRSEDGKGQHINLEFVSANPTGPLTIAHGRQAAIGDTLSRILRFSGYKVTNEYYLNDVGRQIRMLGESLFVRYRNLTGEKDAMPDDGYMGEYMIDIARKVLEEKGPSLKARTPETEEFFRKYAVGHIMDLIYKDLDDFGVEFDVWKPQSDIEHGDEVRKALDLLRANGYIYDQDGAVWFASTRFGDDKDRVVVKSDGSYTYLAPDIAYHLDKYSRGFTRLIDLLGPDHHGYIKRMKAAVQAMGQDASSLDIMIVQLVTLLNAGEKLSMSTRKGEFVSLREIIDEIGKDVARFFFLSRRLDSHLDFDLELAKKESSDNPVYYIQYAHARICSIKAFGSDALDKASPGGRDLSLLSTGQEKDLMRKLGEFPLAVSAAASALEPNRLVVYLSELARAFHSFYTECRVVSDDAALSGARLFLVECVRIVLANGLNLLNITLPEKM
ncbi:MAG: arginine--tRNA ligase [Candidatus Omnitrophica bacterium]|nr:arginine--tRNA ligase [Candidatus Omnitrophota bacterium]MDD5488398.1 arginine--tRNA ligase [Candidatus Omnitrophota bacterium]